MEFKFGDKLRLSLDFFQILIIIIKKNIMIRFENTAILKCS